MFSPASCARAVVDDTEFHQIDGRHLATRPLAASGLVERDGPCGAGYPAARQPALCFVSGMQGSLRVTHNRRFLPFPRWGRAGKEPV